jgi:hypothetical protein
MSNLTTKQLQDAEAFLNAHSTRILKKDFGYITCTMTEKITSLDELGGYDTNNMIELINSAIHFKNISEALEQLKDHLRNQKEEGYTD